MRIVHIVNWYPNKYNPKEALWVQKHISSLDKYMKYQKIIHVSVSIGKIKFYRTKTKDFEQLIIRIPINFWLLIEILSSLVTFYMLLKSKANRNFDIVNFHIAYPNLTFFNLFNKWLKIPSVITEHWSAYHFNFGAAKNLSRIQKIFKQNIPVIGVSKALIKDIEGFSQSNFPNYVIPNIVNGSVFYKNVDIDRESRRFFMVSLWKEPKKPDVIINAFKKILIEFPDSKLYIGGYGPLMEEMKNLAQGVPQITFLGILDADQIAIQLNKATAFLHVSAYETFSVVCAEAASCGCPVIASNVGGIAEFISDRNGILLDENKSDAFFKAMKRQIEIPLNVTDLPNFSSMIVGKKYYEVLHKVVKY